MKRRSWIQASFLLCTTVLTSCSRDQGQGDEILIGEYGSLTGTTATFGISTMNGIEMALDEVNQSGGLLGKTVRVIVEDDQGRPEEAQTVVTKLITRDRVVALLGEVASSRTLAAAPVAQQMGIPMVSPSSTNPAVTEVGDFIFRVCFIDPFQGLVMAKFAAQSLQLTDVAVLRDIKNDYSVGLADVFVENFRTLGGTIVADEGYSEGDTDFSAQLTSIRARRPQAIFVPGYYTEVGLIARQAKSLGIEVPLLGGDGWDSPSLVEIGGAALEGSYFSNHYSVDDPSPAIQKFVGDYRDRYGATPDALAGLGYDAAQILFDAIRRAGSADPTAIRDALAQTKDFAGVTGVTTLDENRNAVKPAVVLQVNDGKLVYVETINP
ncbi:MAG TPA: ethanolamine utilization protein EutJ [Gemmatimonadetes bacterium]|nr:ethanolamine utilization protein EutJ [Gemmatimonadota bacterium]|tara:strand:- start:61955 stop:63094 length:1140 start_codon:yes stop_codon:yes gene_type:complete